MLGTSTLSELNDLEKGLWSIYHIGFVMGCYMVYGPNSVVHVVLNERRGSILP